MTLVFAAVSSDGWAFVREGEACWQLRPPYRPQDVHSVPDHQAFRMMVSEGFEVVGEEYPDWESLVRSVRESWESRAAQASPEERARAEGAARRMLSRASADQVKRLLSKVSAAVNEGRVAGAQGALEALLEAESVRSDAALLAEVQGLARRCREG